MAPHVSLLASAEGTLLETTARIWIHFDIPKSNKLLKTVLRATDAIDVPLNTKVDSLPSLFKDVVLHRIGSDERVLDELQNAGQFIKLSCYLTVPGWGTLSLDGRTRFDEVEDLYRDSRHQGVEAVVKVGLKRARGTEEDSVQIASPKSRAPFLRIGNLPIPDQTQYEQQDRRINNRDWSPGYCWPILVTYNEDLTVFQYNWIHGFDFDEFCIGDVDESGRGSRVKFDANWRCGIFTRRSYYVETEEEFLARLRVHIKNGATSQLTGMPFLPTYCLAAWYPSQYGQALKKWPKKDVDIAVRIINRHNDVGGVSFPRDIREILEVHDGFDQICELVEKNMNVKGKQDGLSVNSRYLFSKRIRSKWSLELWVMPQFGPRKLFRYAKGGLLQFLDGSGKLRRTDKKLYVEAHVVPKLRQ